MNYVILQYHRAPRLQYLYGGCVVQPMTARGAGPRTALHTLSGRFFGQPLNSSLKGGGRAPSVSLW